jgi:hypothetical protein
MIKICFEDYGSLGCNAVEIGKIRTLRMILSLQVQCRIVIQQKKLALSAGFFLGLLLDPEEGGDMFLLDDWHSPNITVLEPRRESLHSHLRENLKFGTVRHALTEMFFF